MNLARAFGELELGAELYCLHKNRWWQTSRGPLLDSGAFVAGLEYAAGVEATVLGKPSPAYFEAALEALDAEPELTWMVGDDLDADVAGAQRYGLKTVLVRTGKFRPDELERSTVVPDAVISSIAVPARVAGAGRCDRRRRPDRDRADPARARAVPVLPRALLHRGRAAYCDSRPNPAQHYAARFAGKEAVGKAIGFGVARAFAWRDVEIAGRPKPAVRLSGRRGGVGRAGRRGEPRPLDDALARARARAVCCRRPTALEPLYTAEEMQAAEAGTTSRTLMERAGRAVAEEALRRYPDARSFGAVCGGGANGGDGRIALEVLRAAGRERGRGRPSGDVLIDALFGTGFHGEPRPEAAALIEEMNAARRPVVAVDLPSGVDADTGEVAGAAVRRRRDRDHARREGRTRGRAGPVPRRRAWSSPTSGSSPARPARRSSTARCSASCRASAKPTTSTRPGRVLVVGGSPGMAGAVTLTASAAFRADAGYVTICSRGRAVPVLRGGEAAARGGARRRRRATARSRSAPASGGRTRSARSSAACSRRPSCRRSSTPTRSSGSSRSTRAAPTVLTPHEGELGRLLDRESAWVAAHRLAAVTRGGGAVRLRLPAEGRRRARRRARARASWSPRWGRRRSPPRAPATCSPA